MKRESDVVKIGKRLCRFVGVDYSSVFRIKIVADIHEFPLVSLSIYDAAKTANKNKDGVVWSVKEYRLTTKGNKIILGSLIKEQIFE